MKFENSFVVDAPLATVWQAMMDFERVAPCMPGAEVLERAGEDAYKVQVRVKVGPMSMAYRGQAEITDRDEAGGAAAMRVQARETRGQGTANATVQIKLAQESAGTRATMSTDLKLSGRAAAMGRGVIADVSQALVSEFAGNLARMLSESPQDGAARASAAAAQATDAAAAPVKEKEDSAPTPPSTTPPAAGPPPPEAPSSSAAAPLDAGQLARTVVASRLREPRTLLFAGGTLAFASLVLGFKLGRSRRPWPSRV